MHKYFKAAGFPDYITERAVLDFIDRRVILPENLYTELQVDPETLLREYRLMVNDAIGIRAAVIVTDGHQPALSYYFPFYETFEETGTSPCSIERHTEKETYSGLVEDFTPGISLIFYMINSIDYRRKLLAGADPLKTYKGVYLSAFANDGKVLLPIAKKEQDIIADNLARNERRRLQEAAMAGDEDAGLQLDNQEVFLFDQINERVQKEDLYSLVDQTFIPWGVECDQYSILGEIASVNETRNCFTGIPMWLLEVVCNDVTFRLCVRKQDLLGEPEPGRRIKCGIWLHGHVNLEA